MKVLMLTQFFPPELCAASNRNAAVAAQLLQAGHDVHVLTGFPNFPTGVIPAAYRGRLSTHELVEGIRTTRLWTFASPRRSGALRLLNWASLAGSASLYLVAPREPMDVLYVSSPPITLAMPALLGAMPRGTRLVVDIRDSYPEVAIRMGMWRASSPLARVVGAVAQALYHRADCVVAVTESVREEIVARGCDPEKILVAPNGYDRVEPDARPPFSRRRGEFVAVFVGNFGLAAGVDVILDAAALLRDDARIRIVLVGDGSEFQRVHARAGAERLSNVELLGALSRPAAMAALGAADLCLVPLKRNLVDSLPTKLFDALSVGCPVLVSAGGEARRFVERSGGGWSVSPEEPQALAAALRAIVDAPAERAKRAAVGRSYVEERYARARSAASIVARIEELVGRPWAAAQDDAEKASA
ncbi:glycosyltransferase WbuB [bacterium]|nr:MAG: glycosyltransferase WbuB [bacterium]